MWHVGLCTSIISQSNHLLKVSETKNIAKQNGLNNQIIFLESLHLHKVDYKCLF